MGLKTDNPTHNLLLGEGAGRKRNEVCSPGTSFSPRLALHGIVSAATFIYVSAFRLPHFLADICRLKYTDAFRLQGIAAVNVLYIHLHGCT